MAIGIGIFQSAIRGLRREDGAVNETRPFWPQLDLLSPERQLTLDGREEPLLAPRPAELVGIEGGKDEKTLNLGLWTRGTPYPKQLEMLLPKSCLACIYGSWHLPLTNKQTGEVVRIPFQCKSWRCPNCQRGVAAVDFCRTRDALLACDPNELVFLVLTLDQKAEEANGLTAKTSYATVQRRWQTLIQRIRRAYGETKVVRTTEQHKTGWPHINVVLKSPGLAASLKGRFDKGARTVTGELRDAIVSAGFGPVAWVDRPRDVTAIAGYLVKQAHRESLVGEVVKISQLPVMAPFRTRRLNSTPGFLPKKFGSTGEWTGELVKQSLTEVRALEALKVELAKEDTRTWFWRAIGLLPTLLAAGGEPVAQQCSRLLPQRDPKGAAGAAKQASGAGGRACLVSTRTSHTAGLSSHRKLLLLEAKPGADPPLGAVSAEDFTAETVGNVADDGRRPSHATH